MVSSAGKRAWWRSRRRLCHVQLFRWRKWNVHSAHSVVVVVVVELRRNGRLHRRVHEGHQVHLRNRWWCLRCCACHRSHNVRRRCLVLWHGLWWWIHSQMVCDISDLVSRVCRCCGAGVLAMLGKLEGSFLKHCGGRSP